MEKISGIELMNQFGDFVNTFNRRGEEVIEGFSRQHRTLQQSIVRTMLNVIEHAASDDYRTDGRNEDTKKVAKMLVNGFREMVIKELMEQGYSRKKAEEYASADHYRMSKYLRSI